jgi:RNA polymerase sigma-70 factor (ECF subfamily)
VDERRWTALVPQVRAGDTVALRELYARSHRAVFTLLVRMTQSRDLAEELTTEVYAALLRGAVPPPVRNELVLQSILAFARSAALDRMRSDRAAQRARYDGGSGAFRFDMPDYRDIVRFRASETTVGAALSRLAPAQREVLEATCFDGHTCRSAAEVLGRPAGQVAGLLHDAISGLARDLTPGADARAGGCLHAEATCALAVGALPGDDADALGAHLPDCAPCTELLASLDGLVGALVAAPTDVLRPRGAVLSRVLDAVGGAPGPAAVPDGARRPWRSVAPGISCSLLSVDAETDRVGMLVRLAPGGVYPPHAHASGEDLYLLRGELWIDALKVYPGDHVRAEQGSRDEHVWSETGCTCVLITGADDLLGAA